jgi:hypothetical protein
MLADAAHPVLEQEPRADDDSSPVNFIGETVGDRLRVATGMKAKVVAIATKDRAAVLLGGRLGSAYWMSEENGKMTTSTYYATELLHVANHLFVYDGETVLLTKGSLQGNGS